MSSADQRPVVLVTGGAGFIGCHTVEALLDDGWQVHVIDDLSHPSWRKLDRRAELVEADINSPVARETIVGLAPRVILHLAAQGGVNRSWADPGVDATINVVGTVRLLEAAVAAGVQRFVMASSGGAIYGAAEQLPTDEEAPRQPRSPYGTAKLCAEAYLGTFTRIKGLQTLALRYGNVYGPGQDGTGEAGVVAISCERILRGERPLLRGDGTQTRDFVFVRDIARANAVAVAGAATGAVNVGTGVETSIREVVEAVAAAAGDDHEIETAPLPAGEVAHSCLDTARAVEQLGWQSSISLQTGIQETWEAFAARAAGS